MMNNENDIVITVNPRFVAFMIVVVAVCFTAVMIWG
jgi:hypothetical protein